MQSTKDIIAGMDFDSMLKEVGADKPKQTRPNDAKWQNNAVQYRPIGTSAWHFWKFKGQEPACPKEWDFNDGRTEVENLRRTLAEYNYEFRLVAILEVK